MNNPSPILIVESQGPLRETLEKCLRKQGFWTVSTDRVDMPRSIRKYRPVLVIVGPAQADTSNLHQLTHHIRASAAEISVVLLTQSSSEDLAIEALRAGLNGYVKYPCPDNEIGDEIRRCIGTLATDPNADSREAEQMIGEGRSMRNVKDYLLRAASTDSNILITGETGTGKELAAEFVHRHSRRRNRPLVTMNCAAIPDTLLESELFGYERGAFTGAHSTKDGKLKIADGGTIFLMKSEI